MGVGDAMRDGAQAVIVAAILALPLLPRPAVGAEGCVGAMTAEMADAAGSEGIPVDAAAVNASPRSMADDAQTMVFGPRWTAVTVVAAVMFGLAPDAPVPDAGGIGRRDGPQSDAAAEPSRADAQRSATVRMREADREWLGLSVRNAVTVSREAETLGTELWAREGRPGPGQRSVYEWHGHGLGGLE
ncbi:MAG: hypothetical protein AAGD08_07635 [Pseudomonadota bacterium]